MKNNGLYANGRSIYEFRDVREYHEDRALAIAEAYAGSARGEQNQLLTLRKLHESDPANIPDPLIILRWVREIPRFAIAMREAERARARELAEECIDIADDPARSAAHARNAIDARLKLAGMFDAAAFGTASGEARDKPPGIGANGGEVEADDAELLAIIREAQARRAAPDPLALGYEPTKSPGEGEGQGALVDSAGRAEDG